MDSGKCFKAPAKPPQTQGHAVDVCRNHAEFEKRRCGIFHSHLKKKAVPKSSNNVTFDQQVDSIQIQLKFNMLINS